jgi:ABC-2 type transport system ATP-binding protein
MQNAEGKGQFCVLRSAFCIPLDLCLAPTTIARNTMPVPIQLHNLSKRFRSGFLIREIRALESVSFQVEPGEIFGFLGPNGAGKTTAIKIIMGLTRPSGGTCTVLGSSPNTPAVKRRIGFLPEAPYFYEHLSAREVLELSADLCGIPRDQRQGRVDRMLEMVSMSSAQHGRLGKFSRGMLQRVGIAQALLHDPELVVLDEPMGGLDPIGRKEFREIIVGLRNQGKTVFFSTHILQDVEMICDRVGIVVAGRLASVGRLDAIVSAEVESIELTFRDVSEAAVRAGGVKIMSIIPSEKLLLATVHTEEEADHLIARMAAAGGKLVSMAPRTHTLEDFFVKQVRK